MGFPMSRNRHPIKEIEEVLNTLEAQGWRVENAKGGNAHAWGFALCPANKGSECRAGQHCRMSVWGTPGNPEKHALNLSRNANGCLFKVGNAEKMEGKDHGKESNKKDSKEGDR